MKRLFTLHFLILIGLGGLAQDHVIHRAMKDEMTRNIDSLRREGNGPFFISYALSNAIIQSTGAVFGSLTHATEKKVKGWNSRVMVGDYQVNDENYEDDGNYDVSYLSYPQIPLEDDYTSIRRFFWIATNNIFEEANRLYKSKKENLDRYQIDYSVPDFDQTPVVELYQENQVSLVSLDMVKQLVKSLSNAFNEHPEILRSNVNWVATKAEIFFRNSEGTTYQVPYNLATLSISAEALGTNGTMVGDNITISDKSFQQLVERGDEMEDLIAEMINALREMANTDQDAPSYYGPALISGELVGNLVSQNLTGANLLVASRENLSIQTGRQANTYFKNILKKDEQEERVLDSNLSIYALPKSSTYSDLPLIGSISIDGEGVVPPDTIRLIDKGVLKEKLGSRTPASKALKSNGHNLNLMSGGNLFKAVSVTNLVVEAETTMSREELIEELINKVADAGEDYGLIVQPAYEGSTRLARFTKVFPDGTRESYLGKTPALFQSNILKRVGGIEDQIQVVNSGGSQYGQFSHPFSIVCPRSFLLDGFEIRNVEDYLYNEGYQPSLPMPKRN